MMNAANFAVFLTVVSVAVVVLGVALVCLVFLNKAVDQADR